MPGGLVPVLCPRSITPSDDQFALKNLRPSFANGIYLIARIPFGRPDIDVSPAATLVEVNPDTAASPVVSPARRRGDVAIPV